VRASGVTGTAAGALCTGHPVARLDRQFVGLAFLTPVLIYLQQSFGWQMVFFITGGLGIFWALVWYCVYREPADFRATNEAELKLFREGAGASGRLPEGNRSMASVKGGQATWSVCRSVVPSSSSWVASKAMSVAERLSTRLPSRAISKWLPPASASRSLR